jgi:hypothetical protein
MSKPHNFYIIQHIYPFHDIQLIFPTYQLQLPLFFYYNGCFREFMIDNKVLEYVARSNLPPTRSLNWVHSWK